MNALHAALIDASHEAAKRPAFYKALMEADVFVIGHTDQPDGGEHSLQAGAKVSLANWEKADGSPVIPFFTHLEALQRAIDAETSYLSLPARSLFEMTRGTTLFLNPKSDYGKEFVPHEIDALLETGMNQQVESRVVEKETQVLLGQPAEYPTAMVEALRQLLPSHPSVQAAYLCLMHDPESGDKPTLVVGFEGKALDQAMREAGSVVVDTAPDNQPVDFVVVDEHGSGVGGYLRESGAFYQA
ncbi:enhanced serine sensitivity protein SseB C-terminal domain-containing protein [Alcanivorax sp. DP30]|uniref:enhanced serine sensitivity protein SseB C-terminal domain-containing protein n=1 Tax=Alcanivorax sp. DP30 TaxID=2606217 RepID=UPI001370C89D|nr:enhanced serine sensitivity protein SseB C-terminal domain-containing protein [Alcanivorax sp. DP30]MZR61440.1 enhanced serine sensitivity protein SseB [Alcanivorax sp. DP30]